MTLDYHRLKAHIFPEGLQHYGEDDCILYALGVGAGLAEDDAIGDELHLLHEDGLRALPAMAAVLAYPGFWMQDPTHGLAWQQVVHGEQRMRFAHSLPTRAQVACSMTVSHIADKAPGAIVVTRRVLRDTASGKELADIAQWNICRGDAGYAGGDPALSDPLPPPIPPPPDTPTTRRFTLPIARNQAALYRLNADRNPLHIDPDAARRAGYPRPILHGAALLGMVNRALEAVLRGLPGQRLGALNLRFTAPVFPGVPVTVLLWENPQGACLACRQQDTLCAYGQAAWTLETQP